jgi:hypothetical protein
MVVVMMVMLFDLQRLKVLNDCLKLHLLTSFVLATFLLRDFFEALLLDEKGAKET